MVGRSLIPLLADAGWHVEAFSRQSRVARQYGDQGTRATSRLLERSDCCHAGPCATQEKITHWVCLAPIWVLPDYFPMLTACRAKRVVALGSTSVFTKKTSSD